MIKNFIGGLIALLIAVYHAEELEQRNIICF